MADAGFSRFEESVGVESCSKGVQPPAEGTRRCSELRFVEGCGSRGLRGEHGRVGEP